MFASLFGSVQKKYVDTIILSVNHVGYKVLCSQQTINELILGQSYFFFVETLIGEDYIKLYGFLSDAEKNWFNCLSSVQGVGGKAALSILSIARPDAISDAILLGDRTIITKASGVGPKLADRIINELKTKKDLPQVYDLEDDIVCVPYPAQSDELGDISHSTALNHSPQLEMTETIEKKQISSRLPENIQKRKIIDNATSALINLGYTRTDALKSVMAVQSDETIISENILIGAALKYIAQLKEEV